MEFKKWSVEWSLRNSLDKSVHWVENEQSPRIFSKFDSFDNFQLFESKLPRYNLQYLLDQDIKFEDDLKKSLWEKPWTKVHIESKMHLVLINFQNSITLIIFNNLYQNYDVTHLQYLLNQYIKFEDNLMNSLWETTWTKVHIESKMHLVLINFQNPIILTIFNFLNQNYDVPHVQHI